LAHKDRINKESACEKCIVKETVTELSSVQLIIEILQKGSNMSTISENVSNSISPTFHEEVYQEVINNWKPVNSRNSRDPTKLLKHVKLLPNSQLTGTSNQYSILVGLKQTDRSGNKSSKPMEQETFNITNKKHISVNTLVSDKTISDKKLTDSAMQPTSLYNL